MSVRENTKPEEEIMQKSEEECILKHRYPGNLDKGGHCLLLCFTVPPDSTAH